MNLENLYCDNLIKAIQPMELCGQPPEIEVTQKEDNLYHLKFTYALKEGGTQGDLNVCIQMPADPDFCWSPHLTPEEGFIVQQHVFRTPAMIFQYQNVPATVMVFPDLETMKAHNGYWYMDMDAPAGKMYYGISDKQIPIHVLFTKDGEVSYPAGKTVISFYLYVCDSVLENPFRPVLDFYWSRYGRQDALDVTPAKKDVDI